MMRRTCIYACALLAALMAACGQREQSAALAASAPPAAVAAPESKPGTAAPDFGGVKKVSREVEAVGSTQELAVLAALQSAVAQVNGVRVASQMQGVRAGLDVSVNGQPAGSARAEAFAQTLIAASQGAVTGFEVLSQERIDQVDKEIVARVRASDGGYSYSASSSSQAKFSAQGEGSARVKAGGDSAKVSGSFSQSGSASESAQVNAKRGESAYASDTTYKKMQSYWKVRIRAEVAQYQAPEEQGRPKIVVAHPRTSSAAYTVGDGRENASEVARAVRGRLSDILTQTRRFIVLDREFSSEMQAEIDHINSGNVRVEDSARLGQQLATDLILIPTVERFEYLKATRQLRMSDRELVSYSGGGRITLRLVNATTGEVVLSDSFEHKLASADPSTMPRVIDGKSMAAQMMDSLSAQIGQAIVTQIFPVSVVALTGDQVVLSQGGESLQPGQRWQAVYLGEELKDPQTGRSLGRHEIPFGTVRVDRVSTQTSYGTVEEGAAALGDKPFKAGAIELRKLQGKAVPATRVVEQQTATVSGSSSTATAVAPKPARKATRTEADESAVAPVATPKSQNDDKW